MSPRRKRRIMNFFDRNDIKEIEIISSLKYPTLSPEDALERYYKVSLEEAREQAGIDTINYYKEHEEEMDSILSLQYLI